DAVLGVAGGFALGQQHRGRLHAVHYDLGLRRCTAHELGAAEEATCQWYYFDKYHSVVAYQGSEYRGVDLATGERLVWRNMQPPSDSRVGRACAETLPLVCPPPNLVIRPSTAATPGGPAIHLKGDTGTLLLLNVETPWKSFTPL